MNRTRASALLDGVSYVVLTILVWGVNAPLRGLWQDDVQALGEAFRRSSRRFLVLFAPDPAPLRRLTVLPSTIAWATPHPIWTLHVLCAAIWLGQGLLAGWIAGLLLPGRRWTRFAVVCLTLTATSDFTAGSMVTLAYNFAVLLLLAAAGCALLWMGGGRMVALIASPILLACSLLTMEVAFPAVPFLILLFVWLADWRPARRLAVLLSAWGIVLIPMAIVEWSFLRDPRSYAAVALMPMTARAFAARTIKLWLANFAPWRWPFARHEWFVRPPAVIPTVWMALGALFAVSLFLLRARKKDDDATDSSRLVPLVVLFAMMALLANAAYARVQLSELHYRTHILSRIWSSLSIGIFAGWIGIRWPRLRWLAGAVVAAFVFFGTWGGIERQDYFLATWRWHQRELASILAAAPSVRPGTAVILRSTTTSGRYLATEADYLEVHWLRILYNDPKLRTMRLNPRRGGICSPTAAGVDCLPEGLGAYDVKNHGDLFHFEDLVVMDYDAPSGTYHLVRSLQGDPLVRGFERDAERYQPEGRIVVRPWTVRQERLLLRDE